MYQRFDKFPLQLFNLAVLNGYFSSCGFNLLKLNLAQSIKIKFLFQDKKLIGFNEI